MKFLQIDTYDDDIPVLCYIEEQWEGRTVNGFIMQFWDCQVIRCVFATGLFTVYCKQTSLETKIFAIY